MEKFYVRKGGLDSDGLHFIKEEILANSAEEAAENYFNKLFASFTDFTTGAVFGLLATELYVSRDFSGEEAKFEFCLSQATSCKIEKETK
jgi:hypothetical protein